MALKQVQTTCAYCGAGCQIMFTVDTDANKIVEAVPADGRTNAGTLCLKGHYGWDYLNDPQILTKRLRKPMIRKKITPCRGFLGGSNFLCSETSWGNQRKIRSGFHYGNRLCQRSRKRGQLSDAEIYARVHRHQQRRSLRPNMTCAFGSGSTVFFRFRRNVNGHPGDRGCRLFTLLRL